MELADAAAYIKSAVLMKKFCCKEPDNITLSGALRKEAELLPDLVEYAEAILKELNPDGSVKDNHPLLKKARARIAGLHGRINKITSVYMAENRDIWQAAVPSQRDGRIVLPLKSNFRGRVKGLVHEVSTSGATVFIEPFDLVELNNEMTFEQNQLNQQVIKIYRGLTDKLREGVDELDTLNRQVSYLDSWYARAEYSIRNKCIRPQNCENGIVIKKGRHPLLGESAVPISLSYNDEISILIITGPNAGGKTVTLKTCGIFVLMNQFACELPAMEGTAIGMYDDVFADIGDDQSIEESLSTFSGHMKRISEITKKAGSSSLVLLDELGSGTDPSQGSAIAMGILEHLRTNSISTIVTTHHAAVKNFGYTHKGAVNASVAFDAVTMKPTYEIIEGVPGESHALEIAQSIGLPEEIISKAGQYMESGDVTVSEMIRELERRQNLIFERDRKLAEAEKEIREDRRALDLARLRLRQSQHEIGLDDYGKMKSFLKESRKELENLVRELREGEITRVKTKKVKNFVASVEEKLDIEKAEIEKTEEEIALYNSDDENGTDDGVIKLQPGTEVKYRKNNKTGILVEERKKDSWLVAFGNVKLTIKTRDLTAIKSSGKKKAVKASGVAGFTARAVFELDLRGMRAYEAESALIKQIDSALLSGMNEFSIIHGLGEGVLQKTVQDFLRSCEAVKSFSFSDPEQGGFGKTIVRL